MVIRWVKLEPSGLAQVEGRKRSIPSIGIRARVLNRQPHVGHAELCNDRSIDQLHHGMHDRLRMDDDLDLIGADTEQPVRLDDLEPLVHQRRRIDGDLPAHLPCRMTKRLIRRDPLQLRRGEIAKRSARGGENQSSNLALVSPVQALVDGVVLAVHGKNRHVVPAGRRRHQRTGHHQHFLVGERDRLAGRDRREHGLEARGPGGGADHDVHGWMRGHRHQTFGATGHRDAHVRAARRTKTIDTLARRHRDDVRGIPTHLLRKEWRVVAGGERHDLQSFGMRIHDGQRAPADRSRRAENGQSLHVTFRM